MKLRTIKPKKGILKWYTHVFPPILYLHNLQKNGYFLMIFPRWFILPIKSEFNAGKIIDEYEHIHTDKHHIYIYKMKPKKFEKTKKKLCDVCYFVRVHVFLHVKIGYNRNQHHLKGIFRKFHSKVTHLKKKLCGSKVREGVHLWWYPGVIINHFARYKTSFYLEIKKTIASIFERLFFTNTSSTRWKMNSILS